MISATTPAASNDVLEVIQDQQHLTISQMLTGIRRKAERTGDCRLDQAGIGQRGQIDEPRTVLKRLEQRPSCLNRQRGLPHASRTGQRDQASAGRLQQAEKLLELGGAAHQVGHPGGEIGAIDGLELGELAVSQLVQLHRANVLQLMAAEVMEAVGSDQLAGGLRRRVPDRHDRPR